MGNFPYKGLVLQLEKGEDSSILGTKFQRVINIQMLGGLVTVTFFVGFLKGGNFNGMGPRCQWPQGIPTDSPTHLPLLFFPWPLQHVRGFIVEMETSQGLLVGSHPTYIIQVKPTFINDIQVIWKKQQLCPFWLRREVLITLLRCMPTYRMDVGKSVGVWLVKDLLDSFPPASFHVVIWIDPPQLEVTKITPFQRSRIKPPMLLSHSDEPGVSKSCWPKAKKYSPNGIGRIWAP